MLGDPSQSHLTERRQYLRAELTLKGFDRLAGRHDLPLAEPLLQLGGRDVDQLDLVGSVDGGVVEDRPVRRAAEERPHQAHGAVQVA